MWRNHLAFMVRGLRIHRAYAVINMFGLAIGMAACLMILLFVRYEMSYDRWIPDNRNVYEVQSWYHDRESGRDEKLQMTSWVAAQALRKDFPQIRNLVYGFRPRPIFMRKGEALELDDFLFVDGNLLDVLALPLVRGSSDALVAPNSVAITESGAKRLFGSIDVVGKAFTVTSRGKERTFRIAAILKDLPKNSNLKIEAVARIDFPQFNADSPALLTCWECETGWAWAKLAPGGDVKAIEAGLPAWKKRNIPTEDSQGARSNVADSLDWHLVRLSDVHLGEAKNGVMRPAADRTTIATFAIIALLILGIAVVNFTNLATAGASRRAREVALRKVVGATRGQLILQFIGESVMISCLAMLVALSIAELLMPGFSAFLDADIRLNYLGGDGILLPIVVLMLTAGMLGGLYPAIFLSRFQPASVLKANRSTAETAGTGRLRSALVVAQFAVSIALIICTAIIYSQTVYARTADPGYKRDHILQVTMGRAQLSAREDAIERQVRRVPGVDAVGRTTAGIGTLDEFTGDVRVPGQSKPVTLGQYVVDPGFKDAMGLQLVAGRWFDDNRPLDDSTQPYPPDPAVEQALVQRGTNVVVNERAATRLGFRRAADAIGKSVGVALVRLQAGMVPATIVGVIRDARFRSVRDPIEASMFHSEHAGHSHMVVRFHGDPAAVRAGVEKVWKALASDVPFDAHFSEDILVELYKAEDAQTETFAAFALLAVIVACLGLFGLAAFTAERRTKEIGIRKVLGARTRDIVRLLVWQFSKPVIVANLVAWPVAWWIMRDWLNHFDARVALGPVPFLLASFIAFAIAVVTVGGHAIRIARSNPVDALRYE